MTKLEHPILIGIVGAAQGLRGEVRVKPFTEDPMAIAEYGALYTADGRRFEVLDHRFAKTVVVVRFRGINDRNAAEALKGLELFIDRSSLDDEELEEGEYFHADLEGLEAWDAEGRFWGTVSGVLDFGGGDLLELRDEGRKPVVIPFTLAAVPTVDLEAGRILVDPLAAGLIDTGEDDGQEDNGDADPEDLPDEDRPE
ncbi:MULTISPECIES: ribosome maturation factor RimM [Hoeflea]|uniref:Ribosome maturation factor RimM n=1 Tax=Hoeflea alexandrii TaxID=288436 RepID=A0ABT1CT00_9HYPH|nr:MULTISPECIES: ribosome maturation factor RimM [Hoeflea]MBV6648351.1 ribosome maturation factor RimM [Hoeflea sp.]MCO6408680.1 ribosome maturation factor RimM [Hoeflea alexandrii]MCY0151354.1 ribosome maturation factor RimM [Hoeflea alexandrii]VVT34682.1 Ribosome maturation factor RimM [Hoeflea sp. EC-HK425]